MGETNYSFSMDVNKAWLTINPDGTIELGEDLSADEATQKVAKMLAENYSNLHSDLQEKNFKLQEVLQDIIAISDRKHEAWDRAKALLKS